MRACLNVTIFQSVHLRGYGGLAVQDERFVTQLVNDLMVIKPAYLVIDMGSNDLGRKHALRSVDNLALELVMKVL